MVSKTIVAQVTVGSNPTPSATQPPCEPDVRVRLSRGSFVLAVHYQGYLMCGGIALSSR
jgi:hypothetical protein